MAGHAEPRRYEWHGKHRDGTALWLESLPLRITWDGAPALMVTVLDVTERRSQEHERRKIAYDIHDGIAQLMVGAQHHLEAFDYLWRDDASLAEDQLSRGRTKLRQAIVETRRLMTQLRPVSLETLGLIPAVQQFLNELGKDAGWEIDYHAEVAALNLSPDGETALFRILQEALTNAWKHAETPMVRLSLHTEGEKDDQLVVYVQDWGNGFDPVRLQSDAQGIRPHGHAGAGSAAGRRVQHREPAGPRHHRAAADSDAAWGSRMSQAERNRIRVVIADDHPVVREGLRSLLLTAADVEVVGEAGTGAEAVAQAQALRPEVMLLDIRMPDGNGLAVLSQIKAASPDTSVIMVTMHDNPDYISRAIAAGAGRVCAQRGEPAGFPHGDSHRTQTLGGGYSFPVEQNPASGVRRRTDVSAAGGRVAQPGGAGIASFCWPRASAIKKSARDCAAAWEP